MVREFEVHQVADAAAGEQEQGEDCPGANVLPKLDLPEQAADQRQAVGGSTGPAKRCRRLFAGENSSSGIEFVLPDGVHLGKIGFLVPQPRSGPRPPAESFLPTGPTFFCDGVRGLERRFRIVDSKPVTTVAKVKRGR